ncbi:MAG: addiction module protein [Candidatus Hydrogenedentes bacterium]|nr:addiction module protein [Candidatus Hydrogenedentota bacterium]
MAINLPVDEMTVEEKLAAMELLWESLSRKPEDIPSPDWHGEILLEREKRAAEGKAKFSPFEEVKERLRNAAR